jgi:hypothetical protein
VPGPAMAAGGNVPHDLATFVIEAELGIIHGFWGCVAAGATFKSMRRRHTEPGRAVIRRHVADLDAAEAQVNAAYFAWRSGVPTPVGPALDAACAAWRALPEGGSSVLDWAATGGPRTPALSGGRGTPAGSRGDPGRPGRSSPSGGLGRLRAVPTTGGRS